MAVDDLQKGYRFPRIPLNFELPDGYPDVGRISSVTVNPEIREVRFNGEELELQGVYQVVVSYFKNAPPAEADALNRGPVNCDEFFKSLKLQNNGLFVEDDLPEQTAEYKKELYTTSYTKAFHTFLDLEQAGRPGYFRPLMVVAGVDLQPAGGRRLKGELFLELVNKTRRNMW